MTNATRTYEGYPIMLRKIRKTALLLGALVTAHTAISQPPDVVVTDTQGNTAMGTLALGELTTGEYNTADGTSAMSANTSGQRNVAMGQLALSSNTTGSSNIALGMNAGLHLTTGSNNIDIANEGAAGDGGKIRIGTPGSQTETFIAGINSAKITGAPVYVTPSGQLGVLASSERFKTSIAPMGATTRKLARLRPVTFHLRTDPQGTLQYGLIAEQVDQVFPELVLHDGEGRIEGVRYDELAPMLLNELLEVRRSLALQNARLERFGRDRKEIEVQCMELAALRRQLKDLRQEVEASRTPDRSGPCIAPSDR